MVIRTAEVAMASKATYSKSSKESRNVEYKPVICLGGIALAKSGEAVSNSNGTSGKSTTGLTVKNGENQGFLSSLNYHLGKNGEVQEIDDSTAVGSSAGKQVRYATMNYLLRMLLYGRLCNTEETFSDIFEDLFSQSNKFLVTGSSTYEYQESQEVEYSAKGTVVTEDGRELIFDYSFSMSSSFAEKYEKSFQRIEEINFVDPLVINITGNPTKISDQKFYFDLDADGNEEEISQLGDGSGFLAFDKNGDGTINNGSELFGALTGNGFGELRKYDEDGNGWIDENDSIFKSLRIWTMDESGKTELYGLKESDVGAIYLGEIKTNFVNYDSKHEANAAIRSSGLFLHESTGNAGCVQHVDFAT